MGCLACSPSQGRASPISYCLGAEADLGLSPVFRLHEGGSEGVQDGHPFTWWHTAENGAQSLKLSETPGDP